VNINNLGKAAELHLAFSLSSAAGAVPNLSLQNIEHNCVYVLMGFSYSNPHRYIIRTFTNVTMYLHPAQQ
jgi:hypothetical protein